MSGKGKVNGNPYLLAQLRNNVNKDWYVLRLFMCYFYSMFTYLMSVPLMVICSLLRIIKIGLNKIGAGSNLNLFY